MAYSKKEKDKAFAEVCRRIADDNMSVRTILLEKGTPSSETFFKWVDEDESKAKQYVCACDARTDSMADEILEISDENNADMYIDKDGKPKMDGNTVQRSRLMVDTRKWLMSKRNPKKYGDYSKLDVSKNVDISFED